MNNMPIEIACQLKYSFLHLNKQIAETAASAGIQAITTRPPLLITKLKCEAPRLKWGLPGVWLFFSDTCLLTQLIKAGLARHETGQEQKGMHLISLHPFDSLKLFVLMWQ